VHYDTAIMQWVLNPVNQARSWDSFKLWIDPLGRPANGVEYRGDVSSVRGSTPHLSANL